MTFAAAASVAFAADTASIAVMLLIPDALEAGVTDSLFWASLGLVGEEP